MRKINLTLILIMCTAIILLSCSKTTDTPTSAPNENHDGEEQMTELPDDESQINEEAIVLDEEESDSGIQTQIQGFWLVCGYDGVIDDDTRSLGLAMEFIDLAINI